MQRGTEIGRFDQALTALREMFPKLQIQWLPASERLDAAAEISRHAGLDFDVQLNLQHFDELHLSASHFWFEWFPCGEEKVFARFLEACAALISGRGRLVESYIGHRPVASRLQAPLESGG